LLAGRDAKLDHHDDIAYTANLLGTQQVPGRRDVDVDAPQEVFLRDQLHEVRWPYSQTLLLNQLRLVFPGTHDLASVLDHLRPHSPGEGFFLGGDLGLSTAEIAELLNLNHKIVFHCGHSFYRRRQ